MTTEGVFLDLHQYKLLQNILHAAALKSNLNLLLKLL